MMNFNLKLVLIFLIAGISFFESHAQKRLKIEKADALIGQKDSAGVFFDKLVGNVELKQKDTRIFCDSAFFYKKTNNIQAFGRVKITDEDSVTITAKKLFYNGDTKIAQLREDVVFVKLGQLTLYTEFLDSFEENKAAEEVK